jgi:hypothetical protein
MVNEGPAIGPKEPAGSYMQTSGILHSDSAGLPSMDGMRVTSFGVVALVSLLASCASSGLYNMSDDWCAAHLDASAARCPSHQKRVVQDDRQRAVNKEIAQRD